SGVSFFSFLQHCSSEAVMKARVFGSNSSMGFQIAGIIQLYPTIFFRHRKSRRPLASVRAFAGHGYGMDLLPGGSRLGAAASAEKSGQNSNRSALRRAISCNSANVPRIALQRPHRTRTVAGECAG